ncbi:hypothetical protein RRG08_019243 [Elysia crispata]|uniref:Uncharacterized protein n=1 Tax=Elysia crispata TaxID=231223 RepID=A0AAE1ATB1_9GAST|nr:hypothetical protein RRG08_019243 [Elysia crispata]
MPISMTTYQYTASGHNTERSQIDECFYKKIARSDPSDDSPSRSVIMLSVSDDPWIASHQTWTALFLVLGLSLAILLLGGRGDGSPL